MTTPPRKSGVFDGLLHQAASVDGTADPDAYRTFRSRDDAQALGPLVVRDDGLAVLAGRLDDVTLSVVVGSGAGGLTTLARRLGDLPVVAAETVLRDLDDLPTNAERVVAAAAGLPDDVEVYVDIPSGSGSVEAVEVVEAAGLRGRVDLGGTGAASRLSLLVEADLPFKATGLGTDPFGPYGLVPLLMAVEALVDGADPDEAEQLLVAPDQHRAVAAVTGWDSPTRARVRHRICAVDCADVAATLDALAAAGLLATGA